MYSYCFLTQSLYQMILSLEHLISQSLIFISALIDRIMPLHYLVLLLESCYLALEMCREETVFSEAFIPSFRANLLEKKKICPCRYATCFKKSLFYFQDWLSVGVSRASQSITTPISVSSNVTNDGFLVAPDDPEKDRGEQNILLDWASCLHICLPYLWCYYNWSSFAYPC